MPFQDKREILIVVSKGQLVYIPTISMRVGVRIHQFKFTHDRSSNFLYALAVEDCIGDKEFALLKAFIEAKRDIGEGDAELEAILLDAYENGEHHKSNGCNFVDELSWPYAHPACVVHDMYYRLRLGRSNGDRIMMKINSYFGHNFRGWVRWLGLRLGGWVFY